VELPLSEVEPEPLEVAPKVSEAVGLTLMVVQPLAKGAAINEPVGVMVPVALVVTHPLIVGLEALVPAERNGEGDTDSVGVSPSVAEGAPAVPLPVAVLEAVPLGEAEGVQVALREPVPDPVSEGERDGVRVGLSDTVGEDEAEAPSVTDAVGEPVPVGEPVGVALAVLLALPLALPLPLRKAEGEPEARALPAGEVDAQAVADPGSERAADVEGLLEAAAVAEPAPLALRDSESAPEAERLAVAQADWERRALPLTLSESAAVAERRAVAHAEPDTLKVRPPEADGVADGRAEGEVDTASRRTNPWRPGSLPSQSAAAGATGSPYGNPAKPGAPTATPPPTERPSVGAAYEEPPPPPVGQNSAVVTYVPPPPPKKPPPPPPPLRPQPPPVLNEPPFPQPIAPLRDVEPAG
jgi:hypothetical protein